MTRHRTELTRVIARAGKNSQGLFAECLLKRAGYAHATRIGHRNPVGTWATGAAAARGLFAYAGAPTDGFNIADGSGLSRENRCTTRQLATVLAWSHTTPFGRDLHDSLARSGVDGSLRKRLAGSRGRVFAKTGTMRGVSALAGYADGESGPRYAFAIILNGYRGPSTPYREAQDRFCRALTSFAARR